MDALLVEMRILKVGMSYETVNVDHRLLHHLAAGSSPAYEPIIS
jgi:hypothetical protein